MRSIHALNRDWKVHILYFEAFTVLSLIMSKLFLTKAIHKVDWINFFCFLWPQYPFDTVNLRHITEKILLMGKYFILFGVILWVLRSSIWNVHQKNERLSIDVNHLHNRGNLNNQKLRNDDFIHVHLAFDSWQENLLYIQSDQ